MSATHRIMNVHASLSAALGRDPTAREVAEAYGCSPERVRQVVPREKLAPSPNRWARVPREQWECDQAELAKVRALIERHGLSDVDAIVAIVDLAHPSQHVVL